jgi:hypothetical protein
MPFEVCGGQIDNGAALFSNVSISQCQYHSNSDLYSTHRYIYIYIYICLSGCVCVSLLKRTNGNAWEPLSEPENMLYKGTSSVLRIQSVKTFVEYSFHNKKLLYSTK